MENIKGDELYERSNTPPLSRQELKLNLEQKDSDAVEVPEIPSIT